MVDELEENGLHAQRCSRRRTNPGLPLLHKGKNLCSACFCGAMIWPQGTYMRVVVGL